jgi:hypothetical protein
VVEVFPNPGRGIYSLQFIVYNLQSEYKDVRVEVVDLYGKSIMDSPLHRMGEGLGVGAGILELDITGYPAGIYFIRMSAGNELIVKKIVKL